MKKYVSELIGTFILVFVGTSTAVMTATSPETNGGVIAVALAFGLSLIGAGYAVGHISGGHLNPAVSWAMFLDKRLSLKDFLLYSVSQIVGAILASSIVGFMFSQMKEMTTANYAANGFGTMTAMGALMSEIVLTFIFVFIILSVTHSKFTAPGMSVLIIGLSLILLILAGANLSGASLNPARSIGPALFTGELALKELWVFILGPMLGASLSVLVYKYLNNSQTI